MPETRDWWTLAVQAIITPQPQLHIELPEGGWVRISFDKQHSEFPLRAGETITLLSGISAEICREKICLKLLDEAILFFETGTAPEISIKLLASTTFEIPKEEAVTLKSDGVQFPINTRVILPAADPTDTANADTQTALKTIQGTVLCWLPDGGSFVLCEGGSVTWQSKSS